jgi:tellurium resistance protein TerZ
MQLAKGGTINLSKKGETPIFKLGASWGRIGKGLFSSGKSVDLDLCAFGVSNGKVVKECSFRNKNAGYMKSSGDDRSGGKKGGDNEIISIDMSKVPDNTDYIVMVINSYSGQELDKIPYAKIRVYEGRDNDPIRIHCEYNMSNNADFNKARTLIIGKIFKNNNSWDFKAIGETRTYQGINDFIKEIQSV